MVKDVRWPRADLLCWGGVFKGTKSDEEESVVHCVEANKFQDTYVTGTSTLSRQNYDMKQTLVTKYGEIS